MMRTVIVLAAILASGCDANVSGPSPDRYRQPRLDFTCQPQGVEVECLAVLRDVPRLHDSQDVTGEANWSVSDPSVATIQRGIASPVQHGEIEVSARYDRWATPYSLAFLVDPAAPARWLYYVNGVARDARTGERLLGVTVEVIAGYNAGRSATTNTFGAFSIDRLMAGEMVTLRATRPRYGPTEKTVCVSSPVGIGCPFVTLDLAPEG